MMIRVTVGWVALMIFSACSRESSPPSPPTPVAACRQGTAPLTSDQLDECLRGFAFDPRYEYSDEQPLTIIEKAPGPPCPGDPKGTLSCRYGPLAKIEPVIRAHAYSEEDLRQGRFIARITVPKGETSYPKYGLVAGDTTYWWVKTDAAGTGGDSYFITRAKDGTISHKKRVLVRDPYVTEGYQTGRPERALVRWIWTLDDETAKGQCGAASCK
jgi:hypothetical protein